MTFKEFNRWCNEQACDGCWSIENATMCIDIIKFYNSLLFWKREKIWNNSDDKKFAEQLVDWTKNKMGE